MWFAKFFGGREDDSEASAFPPHPAAATSKPATSTIRPSTQHDKAARKSPPVKGFDPYNSGSFDKNRAWEKVIR